MNMYEKCQVEIDKYKEDVMTKGEKLLLTVEKFRDIHYITCPEQVYQSASIIENAYEFIDELMAIVGYLPPEEDDDDDET